MVAGHFQYISNSSGLIEVTNYATATTATATTAGSVNRFVSSTAVMRGDRGTAVIVDQVFGAVGREIWSREADGFLRYTEYDTQTGAVVKSIVDVDTSRTTSPRTVSDRVGFPVPGDMRV